MSEILETVSEQDKTILLDLISASIESVVNDGPLKKYSAYALRRALLEQLLEAEAEEHVEIRRGILENGDFSPKGTWFGNVFLGDSGIMFLARTDRTVRPDVALLESPRGLDLDFYAALREKRRREAD